jgi:translation initiation factor 1
VEIDPKTGLPIEAIAWEELAKGQQTIQISSEKRRFGKVSTIVSGFDDGVDIKDIAKKLKAKLACGGTIKNKAIELQGDHKHNIKEVLIGLGFTAEQINE